MDVIILGAIAVVYSKAIRRDGLVIHSNGCKQRSIGATQLDKLVATHIPDSRNVAMAGAAPGLREAFESDDGLASHVHGHIQTESDRDRVIVTGKNCTVGHRDG